MASYKSGYGTPYLYKLFSNSIEDSYNLFRSLIDQTTLDSSMEVLKDEPFDAVCISGFRTGNNVGSGTDPIDGYIVNKKAHILIRPLSWPAFKNINPLLHGDDPNLANIIAMHPVAISSYSFKEGPGLKYGQILKCYKTSEFTYGFDKPDGEPIMDSNYLNLASRQVSKSAVDIMNGTTPTRLENYVNLNVQKATKEDVLNKSYAYDSSSDIPNKDQHLKMFVSNCHPEFVFYVKAVIYDIWTMVGGSVILNKTYRTVGEQKIYRDKWDAWEAGGKVGNQPYAAKPAWPGSSKHNHGTAADFNVYIGSKVLGSRKNTGATKQDWIGSGVPAIIKGNGLRWGGDFSGNYDPIHMDLPLPKSIQKEIIKKTKSMTNPKKAIAVISQIKLGII
tara:strand:- start:105 stop:1274 length:1170 start_codon:yes stop_codon:yes gene_type:complete